MDERKLYNMRRDYKPMPLTIDDLESDPVLQFENWFNNALKHEDGEVNAMILATCGVNGIPSARVVLLKKFSSDGFVFFTNYLSRKGKEISENNMGSILFFWPNTMRQVRVEGIIEKISPSESDEYFNTRSQESKAAATLSKQSRILNDKESFEREIDLLLAETNIERPQYWGGYILKPVRFEFWQGAQSRTHDRFVYFPNDNVWKIERLYP